MELNPSSIIENGSRNGIICLADLSSAKILWYKSVLVSLMALFIILITVYVQKTRFKKLNDFIGFASAKSSRTVIPSVSMLTIFKELLLYGTDIPKIVEKVFAKYGEIFQLNLLGIYNIVFITNPSMLQKLLTSNEPGHLHKSKWYHKILVGPMENGLVSSRADTWKIHRSAISKTFTYIGLFRQLNIINEHAKRFILTLQESFLLTPGLSKPIESLDKQIQTVTYEIISHISAGTEIHAVSKEDKTRFLYNYERVKELISYRVHHPLNYMNFVWNLQPKKWEMDKRIDELRDFSNKLIAAIRKQFDVDSKNELRTDDMSGRSFVEVMVKAGFSSEEIFTELSTVIAAGHETTNTTLKLLLFLLASNKEYQNKCREEIDQMFDKMNETNTNDVSMEDLKSLTFLDMCINECLRLYPVIPIIARELGTPIQLDKNTYLPTGTTVVASPWIIHRNPNIYPEPEKFDPERFLPEDVRKRGMCEYMPFSVGPRNCIGFKSAMIELKVLAAHILHIFEVHSDKSIDDLNQELCKTFWPFPDLGIKVLPRQ